MLDQITDLYTWKTIERLLFSPKGKSDSGKWLKQYHKFIFRLWQQTPEILRGKNFTFNFLNQFKLNFQMPLDVNNYSLHLEYSKAQFNLDFDARFLPESWASNHIGEIIRPDKLSKIKKATISQLDIERVLKSMIVHPAHHIHLEDLSHFVRININTENPFLFLYQVAFQLTNYKTDFRNCNEKQKEFQRVLTLLEKNINATSIPAGELFKLK